MRPPLGGGHYCCRRGQFVSFQVLRLTVRATEGAGIEGVGMVECISCRLVYGLLAGAAFLVYGNADVYAQHVTLRGIVVDSAGTPIPEVNVSIPSLRRLAKTSPTGHFSFDRLRPETVELSVRRLGYEPKYVHAAVGASGLDSLVVLLQTTPASLPGVSVLASEFRRRQGIEDFHERRVRGLGTYITRGEILARQTNRPTDLLRNTPGLRVVQLRGSVQGVRFLTVTSISTGMGRDCLPMIWVDGSKAPGMEIDAISARDIEGIELYNGPSTTPLQFSQAHSSTTCGTIVVWTRPPDSRTP